MWCFTMNPNVTWDYCPVRQCEEGCDYSEFSPFNLNPVWAGGADLLRLVDFSCMSITVLLQKKRASYVPRFNFDGIFFDKKSGFQIVIFFLLQILQKSILSLKILYQESLKF